MLTKVTVYNPLSTVEPLVLNIVDRPETDLFEVRNLDGLGAVKADINTTPMGSIDEEAYIGSNIGKRNIVMTLGLDPDWDEWTPAKLRRILDRYFMPKMHTRLVFESTDFAPVEILGYVETNDPNIFSKDPEHQISIICPKPNFKSVESIVLVDFARPPLEPLELEYLGTVETGFNLIVEDVGDGSPAPHLVVLQINSSIYGDFTVDGWFPDGVLIDELVNEDKHLSLSSVRGDKYIRRVDNITDETQSLLTNVDFNNVWPLLRPGINTVNIYSNVGTQRYILTYFEYFGSL